MIRLGKAGPVHTVKKPVLTGLLLLLSVMLTNTACSVLMQKVSTKTGAWLIALFLLITTGYGQTLRWPLKDRIDLSSGFGDFRLNRFHAGVDLRTGGEIGRQVYSPIEGYVWRVKMSYNGYGKGLYIKGVDDHIYVFGHLSGLAYEIDRAVRKAQHEAGRYYVDLYFPPDSLPIRKGQQIALSGQTGAGAPHLHFERRSPDNLPLNPLNHGFAVNDRTRPTFERIGFHLRDERSLFTDGSRKTYFDVTSTGSPGQYSLDTVLYLDSPFGVLVQGFDQMRSGGMRQSIYSLALIIDGRQYYRSVLDTLAFEIGPTVGLLFDPLQAANGEKQVRRLYHLSGTSHPASRELNGEGGLFGSGPVDSAGLHHGVIIGEDAYGNRSDLSFDFLWDPDASLSKSGSETELPSETSGEYETKQLEITCNVVEDGLIVTAAGMPGVNGKARVALYLGDSLLGVEERRPVVDAGRCHIFVPPRPEYRRVDKVGVSLLSSPTDTMSGRKEVNLAVLGLEEHEIMLVDSLFGITAGCDCFFEPRFISVSREEPPGGSAGIFSSPVYRIMPEAFATRQKFSINLKTDSTGQKAEHSGLCWWDEEEQEWVWITEIGELPADPLAGWVEGLSLGGGRFAAIADFDPPIISNLNVSSGEVLTTLQPLITFRISDTLAGIEDDRFIVIHLNEQLLIPEYDPETEICRAQPYEALVPGEYRLAITVSDRAGNKTEHYTGFSVVDGSR